MAELAGGLGTSVSSADLEASLGARNGFAAQVLPHWLRGLARVLSGTADAKLLCVGDSTTAGVGASGTGVGNVESYPTQLVARLGSAIPCVKGMGIPPTKLAANADPRWTAGTGWTLQSFGAARNACYGGAAQSGALVYADPEVMADTFDVYYLTGAGLGAITVTATGGAGSTVSGNGTYGVNKVTVAAAAAATTNSVSITYNTGGSVYIVGVEPYLSTTRKVRVANAGVGGSKTTDWVSNANNLGGPGLIQAYAPDLTILSLGVNDTSTPVDVATYIANMQTIITAAQSSGDVILMPPFPSQSAAGASLLSYEAQYAAAVRTAFGLPIADLTARVGSGDALAALGMMFDNLHGNALLYGHVAQMLAAGLLFV